MRLIAFREQAFLWLVRRFESLIIGCKISRGFQDNLRRGFGDRFLLAIGLAAVSGIPSAELFTLQLQHLARLVACLHQDSLALFAPQPARILGLEGALEVRAYNADAIRAKVNEIIK